ncbi:MAG: prepilin peptidase [Micavibrio sp.]|nr:prepilin peptidase [Micavibrio sp.]
MNVAKLLICAVLCAAAALLWRLWIVDMRERLLPNIYVFPLACLGVLFHFLTDNVFSTWQDTALGALLGGGLLLTIRTIANWHYKQDTLGLGDVKLLTASGIWLGLDYNLAGLILGALAGLLHGLVDAVLIYRKSGKWPDMGRLEIPAGPGFIVGILIAAIVKFASLPYIIF